MHDRFTIKNLTAYNGSEVLIVESSDYKHTMYDDIIVDWRENFSHNVWTGDKTNENRKLSQILRSGLELFKDLAEDLLIRFICWVLFEPETERQRREKYCG